MRFSQAESAIFSLFHSLHEWYIVNFFLNWLNRFWWTLVINRMLPYKWWCTYWHRHHFMCRVRVCLVYWHWCLCVCVCVCSSVSDESKQQSSELSEQLKLSAQENGAMRLELEELSKRLEMSELMLQQVTDHRPGGSPQWTPNGEGLQRFIGGHFSWGKFCPMCPQCGSHGYMTSFMR